MYSYVTVVNVLILFVGWFGRWPRDGVGEDYGELCGRNKCGGSWDLGSTLQINSLHFFTRYGVP